MTDCIVVKDGASGRSRGFGFVQFRDATACDRIMAQIHEIDGKVVRDSSSSMPFLSLLVSHRLGFPPLE